MQFLEWIILLLFLLFYLILPAKQLNNGCDCCQDTVNMESQLINGNPVFFVKEIEISPIYSGSSFNWSIAGNNNTPNILSELSWRNIQSYGIRFNMGLQLDDDIKPYLSFAVENTYSGEGTDVDYIEDDRQGTVYNKAFDSSKGHYMKLSLSHPIANSGNLLIGLSSTIQKLNLFHEGIEKKSSYSVMWIGLEGKLLNTVYNRDRLAVSFDNSVRLSRYLAKANWVLREDLKQPVSFKHYTFIGEFESAFKVVFKLYRDIFTGFGGHLTVLRSLRGDDVLFFANGDVATTQLNRVNGLRGTCFFLINIKL